MRCVLPWLDSWAAKKPDAAAFEGEKTCLTWRGFLGAWKKPWKTAPNVYKFNIRIH